MEEVHLHNCVRFMVSVVQLYSRRLCEQSWQKFETCHVASKRRWFETHHLDVILVLQGGYDQ